MDIGKYSLASGLSSRDRSCRLGSAEHSGVRILGSRLASERFRFGLQQFVKRLDEFCGITLAHKALYHRGDIRRG
jgi:hypothetical protein